MTVDIDADAVARLVREAASTIILPRYQTLGAHEQTEKSPGDVVTIADRESEAFLSQGLKGLISGSVCVGEEAAHADPAILSALEGEKPVWVIDPVDGTANFAAGRPEFAVIVALMEAGSVSAAWIFQPLLDRFAIGVRGGGVRINEQPVKNDVHPARIEDLRGAVSAKFLPAPMKERVEAAGGGLKETASSGCAGHDYLDLLTGIKDFSLYWRTLPWDHAAGAFLIEQTGGRSTRFDATPYRPADNQNGLVSALSPIAWEWALALTTP